MTIREWVATKLLTSSRVAGRQLGCELEVTVDNQRITTKMKQPTHTDRKVWDRNMYRRGQMYARGYATPIKPAVELDTELAEYDSIDVIHSEYPAEGESALTDGSGEGYVDILSSKLNEKHNQNNTISELITPEEQWNKIYKALLGLAGVIAMFMMAVLYLVSSGGGL